MTYVFVVRNCFASVLPCPHGVMVSQNGPSVNHFLMKTSIHTEQDFEEFQDKLPADLVMIHFKMVGLGPNTLAKADHLGANVCRIAREQPGFFLMSQGGSGLREAMHDLVDRFCDAQEGRT